MLVLPAPRGLNPVPEPEDCDFPDKSTHSEAGRALLTTMAGCTLGASTSESVPKCDRSCGLPQHITDLSPGGSLTMRRSPVWRTVGRPQCGKRFLRLQGRSRVPPNE